MIRVQQHYFKALNEKAGSPEMQRTRHKIGSVASVVLALGTLGAGDKLGISGLLLKSNIAEMIGSIPPALLNAVSPNWPPAGDFSSYPAIDVRQVKASLGSVVGQIVIAYKDAKTPEAEAEAMAKAARAVVGVDTSLDAIKHARLQDYNRRAAIWKACVAEGRCKEAS